MTLDVSQIRVFLEKKADGSKLSAAKIAKEADCSESSIRRLNNRLKYSGLTPAELLDMDSVKLNIYFGFAGEGRSGKASPDWRQVCLFVYGKAAKDNKKEHTLEQAWINYVRANGFTEEVVSRDLKNLPNELLSYSAFTAGFRHWFERCEVFDVTVSDFCSKINQVCPASQIMIDASGDPVCWKDLNGTVHKSVLFVGVLCYSGLTFAYLGPDHSQITWLNFIIAMLRWLNCTAASIKSDNETALVIRRKSEVAPNGKKLYAFEPHPKILALTDQLDIEWVLCEPGEPRQKALCERMVGVFQRIKGHVLGRNPDDLPVAMNEEELNKLLLKDVADFNSKRLSGREFSRQAYYDLHEKPYMYALPEHMPSAEQKFETRLVSTKGYVRFQGHNYFVAKSAIGKRVRIIETQGGKLQIWSVKPAPGKKLKEYEIEYKATPRSCFIKHKEDYSPAERYVSRDVNELCQAASDYPLIEGLLQRVFRGFFEQSRIPDADKTRTCNNVLKLCKEHYPDHASDLKEALGAIEFSGKYDNVSILSCLREHLSRAANKSNARCKIRASAEMICGDSREQSSDDADNQPDHANDYVNKLKNAKRIA